MHLGMSITGLKPVLFQRIVNWLHAVPALPEVSLMLVLLPMLLQCTTGIFLVQREGLKYYTGKCDRGGRVRFFLQRWTALVVLAFITVHFMTMHAWGLHLLYRFTQWQSLSRFTAGGLFHSEDAFAHDSPGLYLSLERRLNGAWCECHRDVSSAGRHLGNSISCLEWCMVRRIALEDIAYAAT
jgi:hypothetical protein